MDADLLTELSPASSRRGRARLVIPFGGAVVLTFVLALIPPRPAGWASDLALAGLAFAAVVLVVVLVPWERISTAVQVVPVALFCLGVAMLRQSAGGALAGYAPLLFLPTVWLALYGRRSALLAASVLCFATLSLPIVLVGAPEYPIAQWRLAVLFSLVTVVVGLVVHWLVMEGRTHEAVLEQVLLASRELAGSPDPRPALCAAARRLGEADAVVLVEQVERGVLRVSAQEPEDAPPVTFSLNDLPRSALDAWLEREAVFVADLVVEHEPEPSVLQRLAVRSVLHQPIVHHERVLGLLTVEWVRQQATVDESVRQALELLAAEAAIALDRASLIDRLAAEARHDALTGLDNRRSWNELVEHELARARRDSSTLTVALVDLDRFKAYNDRFGHPAGDALLVKVSEAWRHVIRPADRLARWGGEEFAVLLPNSSAADARMVLDRMALMMPDGQTFSAGVASSDDDETGDELLRRADRALYDAKAAGRDRVLVAGEPRPDDDRAAGAPPGPGRPTGPGTAAVAGS